MRSFVDNSTDSPALGRGTSACDCNVLAPKDSARTQSHAGYVQLEIRTDTLYNLIDNKALVIEDLRGLDRQAKIWIRNRLLETLLL